MDISHTQPGHQALFHVDGGQAQNHSAGRPQLLMTSRHQRDNRFADSIPQPGNCFPGRAGSLCSVSDSVYRGDEKRGVVAAHQVLIARFAFASKHELRYSIFGHGALYGLHFFTITFVPWPGLEKISNSSINRRTPGSPSPRLPEVEKPSRKACPTSRMPGPLSEAVTAIPTRLLPCTSFTTISPLRAYETMFLASSEMAVAMSVASPEEKPSSNAKDRPFWRARTMSWSEVMVTRISTRDTEALFHFMVLNFWFRYARPSSKSRAVATPSRVKPSCTMAKATSGWIPTMTVSAPRKRIMWAISRKVREAKESMTSIAVTSTMTPRERNLTTCCTRALRSWLRSASERAA